MAADAATLAGAELPPLPDDLRQNLASMLPKFASLSNPLDMTGGASLNGKLMADCLREVLAHDAFDAALLCEGCAGASKGCNRDPEQDFLEHDVFLPMTGD